MFNTNDQNFIKFRYFQIPLIIGIDDFGLFRKLELTNTTLSVNIGLKYRFIVDSNYDNLSSGSNFGGIAFFAFKQRLNSYLEFVLLYKLSEDLNEIKKENNTIKNKNENTIGVGFNLAF
ncbi:MAG: hypothetical protein RBT46_06505 [Weeksellaceae bacterium]|jgi:hypothetical protein|nr:hypothetical protein [Weeksellaceae bacterium]MDX9705341.1 hypothetical protein [Weeksellaceae bacterium]